MHRMKQHILLVCTLLGLASSAHAMNRSQPYDMFLRPHCVRWDRFTISLFAEKGFTTRGYNSQGNRTNPLQIWDCDQNALKMLFGFPAACPASQLLARIQGQGGAPDDGIRGRFDVCGDLDYRFGGGISAYYFMPHNISLSAHLPIYSMELKNVSWTDKTQDLTGADARVKENLTNDFFANVRELGCLELCNWQRTGLGDLSIMAEWLDNFPQRDKEMLHNVMLNGRAALSFPTGKKRDEDKVLALPFGNDGAFSLMFGGGMELDIGDYVKTGLDVELTQVFGNTKVRRIKTDPGQTELLLLAKTCAYMDHGLQQQFTLFGQLYNVCGGVSLRAMYQYTKRGKNELSLLTNNFSTRIANTAQSLRDFTLHNFIVSLSYGFESHFDEDSRVIPSLSLYGKIPFAGTRSAQSTIIGAQLSLDF